MGIRIRPVIALAALCAAMLAAAGSCSWYLGPPGTIRVTVPSLPALDGTTGNLNIEVHEGTATGDLRGLWVENDYSLDSISPFTTTIGYASAGTQVVVAWLDVNKNLTLDTGDVIASAGGTSVTLAPGETVTATVDLDTSVP